MSELDAIPCPFCEPTPRPATYSIGELLPHILERHPSAMIAAGRELLREQAIERTEIEYRAPEEGS